MFETDRKPALLTKALCQQTVIVYSPVEDVVVENLKPTVLSDMAEEIGC